MADCLELLRNGASACGLFVRPPIVEFRSAMAHCAHCGSELKVCKTRTRTVSTLHVGRFLAKEVLLSCDPCCRTYRSEELCELVAPGSNFGYDVMVYAAKALLLRHRTEKEAVVELAEKNVRISPREVSWLAMRFVVYLAIAHQRRAPDIKADMQTRGGYVCHLDATCEGRDPFLMSSIDSLSEVVLGSVKLPAEDQKHIVPFLKRIKDTFGVPVALVHDMGKGILAAVAKVFPGVPDFICHFHFLRDIGKDYLGSEYDTIRKRLGKHGISAALLARAKLLKSEMDANPAMIKALQEGIAGSALAPEALEFAPVVAAYTLIQWVIKGKTDGDGYGFPFDRPHLTFAKRLRHVNAEVERIKNIYLRGQWRDNIPYFKIHIALKPIIKDKTLWKAVAALEAKIAVFEKLRQAMRIALPGGSHGLNDEGRKGNIQTIENRVRSLRDEVLRSKEYTQNYDDQKMIEQIDKYWEKLFADPIYVQTPYGPMLIQPQRTNNILEQFFRSLKRSNRRRTGNASSSRLLRTMLAETPLIRNLENPAYMKILLNKKTSIEQVFAEIEINTMREEFRKAQNSPEKIPRELKKLVSIPDFPEKLTKLIEKSAA